MGSVLIRVITAPSRKTSTPQDSHSQVKASSCQALKHLNHLTKLNLQDSKDEDTDSFKTPSTTLLRQVFNVSSFLRFFVSSRVLRKSYEDTRLLFSWCGAVTCESGKAFFACLGPSKIDHLTAKHSLLVRALALSGLAQLADGAQNVLHKLLDVFP